MDFEAMQHSLRALLRGIRGDKLRPQRDEETNMTAGQDAREAQWLKWRSVADLYHAFFTGLILSVVTRRGTADAAEFVFRRRRGRP